MVSIGIMYYGAFLSGATLADRQMSICKPTEFRDSSIATGFTEQIRKHCGDATSVIKKILSTFHAIPLDKGIARKVTS
jgi:hypothetical protein